jgi:hypothetical protein
MIRQYGHVYWALMGAAFGGVLPFAFQLGPLYIAVGVVVGALFGAALRAWDDDRRSVTMEVPWWEWMLFRFVLYLITAPAVAVTMYLIFRKRGP